ncbi:tyrosine-type recombinase/integrase [Collimonas antrihumi]|uniref:tyrosine-type recombinase/integrase n=1 Tax=Collimonas antrihumi TaxID=1940615 RepID=UPI001B8BF4F6|nr:tyrosine-type recombinase/integrase [Collimonas antrihumi]
MKAPVSWSKRIEDYLIYRHSLGFELKSEAGTLKQFANFLDQTETQGSLTVALTVAWARTSKRSTPITWGRRLEIARGFAQYWQRYDPTSEIAPLDWFGPPHRRLVPHIYTEAEILVLMEAAAQLTPPNGLRPATCRTVFGLLASTGLRIGEATKLTRSDVDLDNAVLIIREAKFHKSRLVPFDPGVTAALRSYARLRDRIVLRAESDRFFLFDTGRPAIQSDIRYALRTLCARLGWQPRSDYKHHRLQDMRHTFIVRSILRFYEQGIEIDRAVVALSTYVGHAHVADTYWYATGIPELMNIAAERFHQYAWETQ